MFELTDQQARELAEREWDYSPPPEPPKPERKPHPLERPVYFKPPESDTLTRHQYKMKTRVKSPVTGGVVKDKQERI